jgi:hypothetical protein
MEVQYSISETDYVKCVKLAATPTRKQMVLLGAGGIGLLMLGVFGPDSVKVVAFPALICGVIGFFTVLYLITPNQAKSHYRKFGSIHTPLFLDILEGGFSIRTEYGHNEVQWEKLLKWREDDTCVIAYFAPKKFYMFPKRIADSGFDMEGFRKSLRENIGTPV